MVNHIGLDIGGSKIEMVVLEDKTGKELYRNKIKTPPYYDNFLQDIAKMIEKAEQKLSGKCSVGLAIPGIVLPSGEVYCSNNLQFLKANVIEDLKKILKRPINIDNDANCFAWSETLDGAAKGSNIAFCVILGTGIGAGLTVNGKLITGYRSMVGEWGHIVQPYPMIGELVAQCSCGGMGHLEALISAPALIRNYNSLSRQEEKVADVREIVQKSEQGEQLATVLLYDFYDRLARAFLEITSIIDPDVFVLGGGLSNIKAIYDEVPERFDFHLRKLNGWAKGKMNTKINLRQATHGDSSGMRGAAWLWKKGEANSASNNLL